MSDIDRILERRAEYYRVLDVPENASEKEIRKSYKALAIKIHPDRNKDPRAAEAFSVLSRAYENMAKGVKTERSATRTYARSAYGDFTAAHTGNEIFEEIFRQFHRAQMNRRRVEYRHVWAESGFGRSTVYEIDVSRRLFIGVLIVFFMWRCLFM